MDAWIVTDDFVTTTAFQRWGIKLTKTCQSEWHGPCFQCGGVDRFWVNQHGHFQCRQCDTKGWLDDHQKFRPDPLLLQHRAEWEKKEKELKEQRFRDWSNGFMAGFYWREWHDCQTQENRDWWHKQGISDHQIDYYELGYLKAKGVEFKGQKVYLPAYTIPIRDRDTWDICNVHYRLVDPPEGVQKYRYESGISAREFYAQPGMTDKVIVTEGAKKAMVTYDRIDGACQVVGLTSCTPGEEMMARLKDYPILYLALDPGCEQQSQRFKKYVPQARVVNLPGKIDDLFISGMTKGQLKSYLRQAR